MAKRQLPSPDYLRQRLRYDAGTGQLFWRYRPTSDFEESNRGRHLHYVWNLRFHGKEAGRITRGRHSVRVDGVDYSSSRVIWALCTGSHPQNDIDHIDGNPLNNRIANLRDVPRSINNRNKKAAPGKSGYVGVRHHKKSGLWNACMYLNNKKISLGYFKTAQDAYAARLEGQEGHGFTDRHVGR